MSYNKLIVILMLCLLGISLTGMAAAEPVTLNLANGDITFAINDEGSLFATGYESDGKRNTENYAEDTIFLIVSLNENNENIPTENRILIRGKEIHKEKIININLKNVSADASGRDKENRTPFELGKNVSVNLTLIDENILIGTEGHAGLKVPNGASITINGPGKLTAIGGNGSGRNSGGAGIGGDGGEAENADTENIPAEPGMSSGEIIIQNGAVIIAVGGVNGSTIPEYSGSGGNAAAIGGGGGGPGTVQAPHINAKPYTGNGADGGDVTYIKIKDATVTAYAEGVAIGGGNGGESAKSKGQTEEDKGKGGNGGSVNKIIIEDSVVTAVSWNATAIGGGNGGYSTFEKFGEGGNADVTIENSTLLAAGSYDSYQKWSVDETEPVIYGAAIGSGGSYGEKSVAPSVSIEGEKTDIIAIGFSLTAGKGSGGENTIEMNNGSLLFIGKDLPLARDSATELSPAGFITETGTFDKIAGASVTADSGYSAFTRTVLLTDVLEEIIEEKYSENKDVDYGFEPGFDELTGFGAVTMWVPLETAAEFTFAADGYPTILVTDVTSGTGEDSNVNFVQYVTMASVINSRNSGSGSGYGTATVADTAGGQESATEPDTESTPATPASGFTDELEPEQESGFNLKLGFGILSLLVIVGCAFVLYSRGKNKQ